MTTSPATMALAAALLIGGSTPGPAVARPPTGSPFADTTSEVELDVPYLPQGPLLCGGAAAAMVERFYGARGVYAEDFDTLVRPAEGGIRTDDLVRTLRARGYQARVRRGSLTSALEALDRGSPPILLLSTGNERLHYVVLVGWDGSTALVHDPLLGPRRRIATERLASQARATDFWTLLVQPDSGHLPTPPTRPTVAHAESNEPEPGRLSKALVALRAGHEDLAETEAQAQLARSPSGPLRNLSWQLIATARFREGRRDAALDAWNRLGEPRVDLVVLDGLEHLRWRAVAGRLPLRHGDTLRARDLATGRRRLSAVPGIVSSRLDYQPLVDGTVEVRGYVAEAGRWPSTSRIGSELVGAVIDERAALSAGPFLSGSERWRLSGQWLEADAAASLTVTGPAPPLPGIAAVTLAWERQRFGLDGVEAGAEERIRGIASLGEWIGPADRVEGRLGLERWGDRGRSITAGGSLRHVVTPGRLGSELSTDAWTGAVRAARGRFGLDARLPRSGREWRLWVRGTWASAGSPRILWDGAGLGVARSPLLRGARLVRNGRIDGPVFGPRLVQASLEHTFLRRLGPVRAGVGLFADAARAWGGIAGDSGWRGAWGVELEGVLDDRRMALSLGTGAGDWIVSLRLGSVHRLY